MVNGLPLAFLGTIVLNVPPEMLYFSSNEETIGISQDSSNLEFCELILHLQMDWEPGLIKDTSRFGDLMKSLITFKGSAFSEVVMLEVDESIIVSKVSRYCSIYCMQGFLFSPCEFLPVPLHLHCSSSSKLTQPEGRKMSSLLPA